MTDQPRFQPRPDSWLENEQVVNYLLEQKRRGYQVFQEPSGNRRYDLLLDEMHRIAFNPPKYGKTQVQGYALNNIVQVFNVTSFAEFRKAVEFLAHAMVGNKWQQTSTSARLREDTPATNLATVSGLIGAASVEAVFDPYLENRSLTALVDILSFGSGSIADGVRVLSTSKTTAGSVPRLSKTGFDAWLTQLEIRGEVRLMGPSEHRRFLLLSGHQSLIIGNSLNALHKNEAVRLEPDKNDRAFFDSVWAKATLLT